MATAPDAHAGRVVVATGAHNVRDLGGLRLAAGGRIRVGRLYRSEYPDFVEADPDTIRSLGIVRVVDLRSQSEIAHRRVDWAAHGIDWRHVALYAGRESSWEADYPAYFEHGAEVLVEAVNSLVEPAARPALFHCAAGKDRTGVVAAVLLSALGVTEEEIVADYVYSDVSFDQVIGRLAGEDPYRELLADRSKHLLRPRAETMHAMLEWLDDRGGARAWLTERGVSACHLDTFVAEMTVDAVNRPQVAIEPSPADD